MVWKFEIFIKDVYEDNLRVIYKEFDKEDFTWCEAWKGCVDYAIESLNGHEVVYSICSVNEIVRFN